LKDELDLDFISKRKILVTNENNKFFNFKLQKRKKSLHDPLFCNKNFEVFSVSTENKCFKVDTSMKDIIQDLKSSKFKYFSILPQKKDKYGAERISTLVKDYALTDPKFKNCISCQFVNKKEGYNGYYNLYCNRFKIKIPTSNFGSSCSSYLRF